MAYLIYALLAITFVGTLTWAKGERLYSPAGLTAAAWFSVFVLGIVAGSEFYPFNDKILLLWLLWFIVSTIGYLVCSGKARTANWTVVARIPFNYVPIMLLLIGLLAYRIWLVGSSGPVNFFLNLRLATILVSDGETTIGWVGNFYPIIFALFIFETVYSGRKNRKRRLLLWMWMLLYAIGTMGKFAILTPISAWLIVKAVKRELPAGKLAWVAAIAIPLMFAVHFLRQGEDGDNMGIGGVLTTYLYGPVIALGQLTPAKAPALTGAYTFRFIYAVAHSVGYGQVPVETILDYVFIPLPLNVYTSLQPFYQDFGAIGVGFGAAAYGVLFGLLFRWTSAGSALALVLYAGLGISIVTQWIGETLITNFSGNLQFVLAAALLSVLFRRMPCPSTS